MKIELYSLPNYYINKNITLTYTGILSLLSNPLKTTTDVAQVDLNNVVVGYNYYNFIKDNINYLRIDEKFCYFISNVSMRNNGNVLLTLEIDSIHTTELLRECNIFDLVGASYVSKGLSSKSKKYNKIINTFTFNNDLVVNSKNYLMSTIEELNSIDLLNYSFVSGIQYKCLYLIVNENWTPINASGSSYKYLVYNTSTSQYTNYVVTTKENNINTNKLMLVIPLSRLYNYGGTLQIYDTFNDTPVSIGDINSFVTSLDFDLFGYISQLVGFDATNIIDYGLTYLPLGDLDIQSIVLPNKDLTSDAFPMLQITNLNKIAISKTYSEIYNNAFSNVYVFEGLDLIELPTPQDTNTINIELYYSIASDYEVKLKINNILSEKGYEIFDISTLSKCSIPVYIDGVERQTLLNSAMIENQKKQLDRTYNFSKSMDLFNTIEQATSLGGKSLTSIEKGDLLSPITGTYSAIIKNISNIETRDINYKAQSEAIRIQKKNLKYATSSFIGGNNILLGSDVIDSPCLFICDYNNDYNKKLYFVNGIDINRVINSSVLKTLNNTFIVCDLNFNVNLNFNIASNIKAIFSNGVYIFNNDTEALNFVNTGLGLMDFEL